MSANPNFLRDFDAVYQRLIEYYEVPLAHDWMHAPHPQLDGKQPIELIHAGETQQVMAVLDKLDAGCYL